MKKVGLIGVGDMGMGIAKNLLGEGFELTVYDVREEPLKKLAQLGAQIALSPKEVGRRSDVVLVMVFDGSQVKQAVLGKDGLLEGMRPGSTIICSSTIFPSEIKEVAEVVQKRDVEMVDSPVSGSAIRAAEGTLTLMVAAKGKVFEDCKEIFQAVGRDIFHVGEEVGMGQLTKAAHQVLVGLTFAGMAEAFVLGVKAGIRPEVLYEVIASGVAGSFLFKTCGKFIMERNFKAGSHMKTILKDLDITVRTGKDYGVPLFATGAVYELFQAAKNIAPEEDSWAVIKVLEEMVGVEVKKTS